MAIKLKRRKRNPSHWPKFRPNMGIYTTPAIDGKPYCPCEVCKAFATIGKAPDADGYVFLSTIKEYEVVMTAMDRERSTMGELSALVGSGSAATLN